MLGELADNMDVAAQQLEFEKAAILKDKIEHLKNYQARSTVVNTRMGTVDVFSILEDEFIIVIEINSSSAFSTPDCSDKISIWS